ncbi:MULTISPECIES: hypothetical protein [unclassified Rhizobium]|uniref:hypothetical protein n=1 Tax=unclassified Rhizobium TaxID=2613769 RepID=UPI001C83B0E9|nr:MULTISPECIES: hypothetical protein [unclassified Rhizobium]MBX5247859.1 hypothetical protein [Rhizobium sp. NLR3b]MBX5308538.1 hypothetical protein [Rhizobium sp. NLR14b]
MAYLEELPEQCPPDTASDAAFGPAYRIVPSPKPEIGHFYSYGLLGKPKPDGVDDCRYRACSLFTSEVNARKIARLPKMRATATHLAKVVLPSGMGAVVVNENTSHVDLWPYDTFDVELAVQDVIAL